LSLKVPVGTVGAYGGDIAGARLAELREEGWLLCDGQGYPPRDDYAGLFGVIGYLFGVDGRENFRVPDLRGVFVRGADHGRHTDPDAGERSTGDKVGSMQGYATGLPIKVFVTGVPLKPTSPPSSIDESGNHTHATPHIPNDDHNTACALPSAPDAQEWNDDAPTTTKAGTHSHTVAGGGDAETRPYNLYLYYIIKFRSDL
jgi:microcystin-dependent protein